MDFINWWFDTLYITSTIITPGFTLAWCLYHDIFWRGIIAFIIWLTVRINFSKFLNK